MIKWDLIALDRVENKFASGLNKTANDTLTNISQAKVVPFHIGTLEKSANIIIATSKELISGISWNTPYARRLYMHPEYNFRNNRKGKWAENWITGNKKKWVLQTFIHNMKGLI